MVGAAAAVKVATAAATEAVVVAVVVAEAAAEAVVAAGAASECAANRGCQKEAKTYERCPSIQTSCHCRCWWERGDCYSLRHCWKFSFCCHSQHPDSHSTSSLATKNRESTDGRQNYEWKETAHYSPQACQPLVSRTQIAPRHRRIFPFQSKYPRQSGHADTVAMSHAYSCRITLFVSKEACLLKKYMLITCCQYAIITHYPSPELSRLRTLAWRQLAELQRRTRPEEEGNGCQIQ